MTNCRQGAVLTAAAVGMGGSAAQMWATGCMSWPADVVCALSTLVFGATCCCDACAGPKQQPLWNGGATPFIAANPAAMER